MLLGVPSRAFALYGFKSRGKYYMVEYKHRNDNLELLMLEELKGAIVNGQLDLWKEHVNKLVVVNPEKLPTVGEVAKLIDYAGNFQGETINWYMLLYNSTISPATVLNCGYIINYPFEPQKYIVTYLIDLDSNTFSIIRQNEQLSYPFSSL